MPLVYQHPCQQGFIVLPRQDAGPILSSTASEEQSQLSLPITCPRGLAHLQNPQPTLLPWQSAGPAFQSASTSDGSGLLLGPHHSPRWRGCALLTSSSSSPLSLQFHLIMLKLLFFLSPCPSHTRTMWWFLPQADYVAHSPLGDTL